MRSLVEAPRPAKSASGQYEVKSPRVFRVVSPAQGEKEQAYPDGFIYMNRSSKTRRFVITRPTTEAEITSEISPEDAFERITSIEAWLSTKGLVPPDFPDPSEYPTIPARPRPDDSSYEEDVPDSRDGVTRSPPSHQNEVTRSPPPYQTESLDGDDEIGTSPEEEESGADGPEVGSNED
jgi:hypothetical protein